jgi:hypothetical protein
MIDMPARFPGTPEQIKANLRTHYFRRDSGRCEDCDCRPWGRVAEWPCGANVPREEVGQAVGEAEIATHMIGAALWSQL